MSTRSYRVRSPVAIVGLYPVTVAAVGPEDLHKALHGKGGGPARASEIDLDISRYTGTKHAYLDPSTKLALAAASGAMSDAGWKGTPDDVGLCFGSAWGCRTSAAAHESTIATKGGRFVSPFVFSHSYPNSPNVVISIDLGLKGFNTCLVCGVVSGGMAVGQAFDQIVLGREKKILAGGSDAADEKIREADSVADGAAAPGACFLALQDAQSAEDEGRRILALLLSWRCGMGHGDALIESALGEAGLGPEDVGVTVGNVETGLACRHLDFDAFLGLTMAASAVLDAASLCVLGNRGEPPEEALFGHVPDFPDGRGEAPSQSPYAVVVRKDPSGPACVLVLRLGA